MHLSRTAMTVGTAVMTVCLGLPFMAQAGSSYDSTDYRNQYDYDYRNQYDYDWSEREWADSRPGKYDVPIDRYPDDRQFYTQQYGSTDTVRTQENLKRNRPAGYWTDDGYRSNTSNQNPRYRNELRKSDETIRRNIINNLGEGTEGVRVTVKNGVAILTGMVLNRETMIAAVEDGYEGGARKVRNQLQLFRHEERPWAEMSDRRLAKAVREEISWSPFVDSDPIRVNVRKGVVTLQGSVADRSEMAAAVDNAYEAGARRVDNRLRIVD